MGKYMKISLKLILGLILLMPYSVKCITVNEWFNLGKQYENERYYYKAIDCYTNAINANKKFTEAYIARGIIYYKLGFYESASNDYTAAIKINSNLYKTYYYRAIIYYEIGKNDKAVNDFSQVINIKSNFYDAYYLRGEIYYKKGLYEKALNDFNKTVSLCSNCIDAHYKIGVIYYIKQWYDKAIIKFSKVIEIGKNNYKASAYYSRGTSYYYKGIYDKSISDFTKAIGINPKAYIYIARGDVYKKIGLTDYAIKDYEEASELDSNIKSEMQYKISEIYTEQGLMNLRNGLYDEAIKDLTSSMNLDPNVESTKFELSYAYGKRAKDYLEASNYDEAISDCLESIKLNPKYACAFYVCGIAYLKKDNKVLALENFKKSADLGYEDSAKFLKESFNDETYLKKIKTYDKSSEFNSLPKGWRFPNEDDYMYDWEQFRDEVPVPFFIKSDFNGDGLKDEAWILISIDMSKWGLFVFLRSKSNMSKVVKLLEEKTFEYDVYYPYHVFIEVVEPGTYKTACGKEYWECAKGEPAKITLKILGILLSPYESGGAQIFYWDKKTNSSKQVWIND